MGFGADVGSAEMADVGIGLDKPLSAIVAHDSIKAVIPSFGIGNLHENRRCLKPYFVDFIPAAGAPSESLFDINLGHHTSPSTRLAAMISSESTRRLCLFNWARRPIFLIGSGSSHQNGFDLNPFLLGGLIRIYPLTKHGIGRSQDKFNKMKLFVVLTLLSWNFVLVGRSLMENNIPSGDNKSWDSDENVIGNLTCSAAARFLSTFTATFRALATSDQSQGPKGQVDIIRGMLASELAILNSGALNEEDQKFSNENIPLLLVAVGMALVTVNCPAKPNQILVLCAQAMEAINKVMDQQDITSRHLDFHVRLSEDKEQVELAVTTTPLDEMELKMAASAVGKAIGLISDKEGQIGMTNQGDN